MTMQLIQRHEGRVWRPSLSSCPSLTAYWPSFSCVRYQQWLLEPCTRSSKQGCHVLCTIQHGLTAFSSPGARCACVAAQAQCQQDPIIKAHLPKLSLQQKFIQDINAVQFGVRYLHLKRLVRQRCQALPLNSGKDLSQIQVIIESAIF